MVHLLTLAAAQSIMYHFGQHKDMYMGNKDHTTNHDLLTVYEKRSTCARVEVAAILVRDGRVVSSGWNGVPAGAQHCEDKFAGVTDFELLHHDDHHDYSRNNEIHAEVNAIGYAAKNGIATDGTTMYITLSPCLECAKMIKAAGITQVFYKRVYDRDPFATGADFLLRHGVVVTQL